MKHLRFRKIYQRMQEGEEHNAIVAFAKIPHLYKTTTLDDKVAFTKGYMVEATVIQYRYKLAIDLWILVIYFDWLSKFKPDGNQS